MKPGQIAEIGKTIKIPLVVTDAETGKRVKAHIVAPGKAGYYVGRLTGGTTDGD